MPITSNELNLSGARSPIKIPLYMKNRNMNIKGMIFNHYIADNIMHEDNIRMCEYMTGLPTLAKVSMGDVDLNIDIAELISLYR